MCRNMPYWCYEYERINKQGVSHAISTNQSKSALCINAEYEKNIIFRRNGATHRLNLSKKAQQIFLYSEQTKLTFAFILSV